ncbi:uncharacterized protein LOC135397729 [Ornithodoros turicata]|uniref:uncharacterized protein LOC135397729 n=1 Tax=Ornithodoros turicata TaxID=34597 RepID=UPI00313A18B5
MDELSYPLYEHQYETEQPPFISTVHGIFTTVELVFGFVLFVWLLRSQINQWPQRFATASAWAYSFNGIHILITASISHLTATYMPTIFYFVMYQFTAALSLIAAGIWIVCGARAPNAPKGHGILSIITGGIHGGHFGYTVVSEYIL